MPRVVSGEIVVAADQTNGLGQTDHDAAVADDVAVGLFAVGVLNASEEFDAVGERDAERRLEGYLQASGAIVWRPFSSVST